MSILNNSLLLGAPAGSSQYTVSRSLRFNSADSAYLSRTPGSAGNRKTWTFSCWVKRSGLSSTQLLFHAYSATNDSGFFDLRFDASDRLEATLWNIGVIQTTQVFRDVSAWYHIVLAVDTTQSTANDRMRMYVNGSEITAFGVNNRGSISNSDLAVNSTAIHNIGRKQYDASAYFSGYLAECYLIDGQQLTPSSFAETNATTGQWVPKAYTGSYGTNGFRLTFSDNSGTTATTLGKDSSGLGNNFTPNNFSVATGAGNDSLVDTPTSYGTDTSVGGEVRGNYCTLNPLDSATQTLANGNLDLTNTSTSWATTKATIGLSTGKWYWETTINNLSTAINSARGMVGIATSSATRTSYLGSDAGGYGYYNSSGQKVNGNSFQSYGATFTNGDVIGVALDCDNGTVTFYKNGASQGQAYTGLVSGPYFPAASLVMDQSGGTPSVTYNFGQRPFAYTAPSGFKALCDTNLPAPQVAKPSTVFDTALWTGNGSNRSITGYGFSPDLIWIKQRSGSSTAHSLHDIVRGTNKHLTSNGTDAEVDVGQYGGGVTAFNSDGMSLGTWGAVNENNQTYVGWAWDGGSSNSTNNAGSITSTVRANASAGFSVLTVSPGSSTQVTIGHGLGVAPGFIIMKQRNSAGSWHVWHSSFTTSEYLFLNSTAAKATSTNLWGTSLPTSTVFGFNIAAGDWVGYAWAPISGLSAFGSYVGNGSASDGPFVYTGFRPRFVLIKNVTNVDGWMIKDTARSTYNPMNEILYPESSNAEGSRVPQDFLSNGFKIRDAASNHNTNGSTYIYAAFAENPFQYARAR